MRSAQRVAAGHLITEPVRTAIGVDQLCNRLFQTADEAAEVALSCNGDAVEGQRKVPAATLDRHAIVLRTDPERSAGEPVPRPARQDSTGADQQTKPVAFCGALRVIPLGPDGAWPRRRVGGGLRAT